LDFTIEEMSLNAWPSLKTVLYDGWVLRFSNGYTNRANSVNPIYPGKINLEEKLRYCEEIYSRYDQTPIFKIVGISNDKPCNEQEAINEKLINLNYVLYDETSIRICDNLEQSNACMEGIIVKSDFYDNWKNSVIVHNKIQERHWPTFKAMLDKIPVEKIVVSKEVDGQIIGCGFGAIENGYVGVFDMIVKEEFRGKSYGRQIIQAILSEAFKKGIRKSYLQVVIKNSPAIKLYDKMGYREVYRYWYRKKA